MRRYKVEWIVPDNKPYRVCTRHYEPFEPSKTCCFDKATWYDAEDNYLYHAQLGYPCALIECDEDGRNRKVMRSRDWDEECEFDHVKHIWRIKWKQVLPDGSIVDQSETHQCSRKEAIDRHTWIRVRRDTSHTFKPTLEIVR